MGVKTGVESPLINGMVGEPLHVLNNGVQKHVVARQHEENPEGVEVKVCMGQPGTV